MIHTAFDVMLANSWLKRRRMKMKKLIIINGTMGVGKTSVCKKLLEQLDHAVWLDGDWCWMMNPWDFSDENKEMVIKNITYLLNSYLANSSYEYVLFCWVIHEQAILDMLLERLHEHEYELYTISLLCNRKKLEENFIKDNRDLSGLAESCKRLTNYLSMDSHIIDITTMDIPNIVYSILQYLEVANNLRRIK